VSHWQFRYAGFEPEQEGLREALCAVGNGRLVTRAAAPEARADDVHYPGTYAAGIYDAQTSVVHGRKVFNEDLVNLPNWLPLSHRVAAGDWFHPARAELESYSQWLQLDTAILHRDLVYRDADGRRTRVATRCLLSMADADLGALEYTVTPLNWSGELSFHCGLDAGVENTGVPRYRALASKHLSVLRCERVDAETIGAAVVTLSSDISIAVAARHRLRIGDAWVDQPGRSFLPDEMRPGDVLTVEAAENRPVSVEKVVAIHHTRQPAVGDPWENSGRSVHWADDFDTLARCHVAAWSALWRRFDVELVAAEGGRNHNQRILRLHLLHLLQTLSLNTVPLDAGVPARGLHGEAYRGHVFWDELFVLPIFNLHMPEVSRATLLYRYYRLPEARRAARQAGLAGALFPWQSGSDGREQTQTLHLNPRSGRWLPDNTRLQRHVNAAIAYNLWSYCQSTGDEQFMHAYGAEMLLEIARLWASLAEYSEDKQRYVITGVMGPDEYHDAYPDTDAPGLDNNAYTNVMAVWCIARALEMLERLPEPVRAELCQYLAVTDEELAIWREIERRMFVPFLSKHVIAQFEGYEQLQEFDWEAHRQRYGNIQRLDRSLEAENDTPNRYRVSKQADAVMLFYLFETQQLQDLFRRMDYDFPPQAIPATIDYYRRRTSHGSTLSFVVHSRVLARLDREQSWEHFRAVLRSDVADVQGGTTREGIHLGAMAGSIDLVTRCYAGLDVRDDVLWIEPMLPLELEELRFSVQFRKAILELEINHHWVRITACSGRAGPIRVGHRGSVVELPLSTCTEFRLQPGATGQEEPAAGEQG